VDFAETGKKKTTTSPMRDVWIHIVTWILLTSTIASGIWQMIASRKPTSPLLISSMASQAKPQE